MKFAEMEKVMFANDVVTTSGDETYCTQEMIDELGMTLELAP